jgi:hypothetical protein
MYKLKKLETILSENKWTYNSDAQAYVFTDLDKFVKADTLQARAGRPVSEDQAKLWPEAFIEQIADGEEVLHKIKLKDVHIALMMTDYKFIPEGLILIFNDEEFFYPSALLPSFGDHIEVRKNKDGELEEARSEVIIHPLLIEGVISSRQALLNSIYSLFAAV